MGGGGEKGKSGVTFTEYCFLKMAYYLLETGAAVDPASEPTQWGAFGWAAAVIFTVRVL